MEAGGRQKGAEQEDTGFAVGFPGAEQAGDRATAATAATSTVVRKETTEPQR